MVSDDFLSYSKSWEDKVLGTKTGYVLNFFIGSIVVGFSVLHCL